MTGLTPLAEAILRRDRGALARAITQIESTRPADRTKAESLLTFLLPHTGRAMRIGISGAPGVGKSTFIEAFGTQIIDEGHRLAVLAVDPSSRRSGGSILGDKTRMESLARNPAAFIRPSPAGATLGGVARRTREAILLCEAAGFDLVMVETVGVGQSETAVSDMVDLFVLLIGPGSGDELQGIKRGVMELADIVLVTKADGELKQPAARAASDYAHALHLMRPKYPDLPPQVMQISAQEGRGLPEAWDAMCRLHLALQASGWLKRLREEQLRRWFWNEMQAVMIEEISGNPAFAQKADTVEAEVVAGRQLPNGAARALIQHFRAS
ncbi:MAG TPA: methylmalonyl Co-A mutase-associated GTPase MeaB [Rhizomicrobium sp.]|jgi:LAO/AO transport system kinase|nr:methylmalonyl Co-A mutase-associated GTPase MeaB [Rhizomicrobium sp.]